MPKTENEILDDFIKERFFLKPNDDLRKSAKDLISFAFYNFQIRFDEFKQKISKTPLFRFIRWLLTRKSNG